MAHGHKEANIYVEHNSHPAIKKLTFTILLKHSMASELEVPDVRGHRALAHFQVRMQNLDESRDAG